MSARKRYNAAREKVDRDKRYNVDDTIKLVVELGTAKFDESIDVAFNLGVDPKQSDQQVRGAVSPLMAEPQRDFTWVGP